jgi:hypothetical protein
LNQEITHIPGSFALSRRNNEKVCSPCGQEEAMLDLHRIRLTRTIKEREDRMAGRPKVAVDKSLPTKKVAKKRKMTEKPRDAETTKEAMKRRRKKDAPEQKPKDSKR